VEIDESKFWKAKDSRGHHVKEQWVFGGVERGNGRIIISRAVPRWSSRNTGIFYQAGDPSWNYNQ